MLKGIVFWVTAELADVGDLYFDRRRRTDKDYKKKVKTRRAQSDETKIPVEPKITAKWESTKFLDLADREDIDAFYNEDIKLAYELLKSGEIEGGI